MTNDKTKTITDNDNNKKINVYKN